MRHYIGIDLGTTNSAICSYDGTETHIWKSPDQADVTPSAIYIDRKGHRFYGRKAFDMAAANEKNAALLFKRYLGTAKTYQMEDAGITLTPVECSAQLLQVLYGYLPEEIRNDPETAAVITVPAAFNQMKKDAALEAARLAGIGRTTLMQEPVAAVMSVLKKEGAEKTFLIYDLGGGTFDVSVARFAGGHVSLLAQGGREMCGGRDLDRKIYQEIVLPWLREHFVLPDDPDESGKYLDMKRCILFAVEEAKIALSSADRSEIWLDEDRLHTCDEAGSEISLELSITRQDLEPLIGEMAGETAEIARETLQKAGIQAEYVDQIVFVGGPTMYAPLRDEVCRLLQVPRGTVVNPMTAVAEGASIYAESIDWEDREHRRKETVEELPGDSEVTIRYEKRVSVPVGRIAVLVPDGRLRTAEITSTGSQNGVPSYSSGKVSIIRQGILEVPLPSAGKHCFSLVIKDEAGNLCMEPQEIEISRVPASVDAIPASHSIAIKALDRPGGIPVPVYLIEANDPLPKSGTVTLRAAQPLVGGSDGALSFSLWEGEIREPVDDNRFIGSYRIPGKAFSAGTVPVGAEIICDYEMNDAGNLRLGVSVPVAGLHMEEQNFYSRFEGQSDLKDTSSLVLEVNDLLARTAQMQLRIADSEVAEVRRKLMDIRHTLSHSVDPESIAHAESDLLECYRRVAVLHQRYSGVIKSQELQKVLDEFALLKKEATSGEIASFRNLEEAARFSIDMVSSDFDSQILEMKRRIAVIQWRNDSHIRNIFTNMISWPGDFEDRAAFDRLRAVGLTCMENNDMDMLRQTVNELFRILRKNKDLQVEKMFDEVTVYRG